MWKTLVVAALGLLLFTGSSRAEKKIAYSTGLDGNGPVQREHRAPVAAQQSFSAHSPLKAVQIHGVLNAKSNGRQVDIAGVGVTVSPQCSIFPDSHPGRPHDLSQWNGKEVTVFGFESSGGVDARLVILNDAARIKLPRAAEESLRTIPSNSDPSVGVTRRDAPQ